MGPLQVFSTLEERLNALQPSNREMQALLTFLRRIYRTQRIENDLTFLLVRQFTAIGALHCLREGAGSLLGARVGLSSSSSWKPFPCALHMRPFTCMHV